MHIKLCVVHFFYGVLLVTMLSSFGKQLVLSVMGRLGALQVNNIVFYCRHLEM
jgi:hypothetical protein